MNPAFLTAVVAFSLAAVACSHEPPKEGWQVTKDPHSGAAKIPVNERDAALSALSEFLPLNLAKKKTPAGRFALVVREESIPVMKKKSLTFPQTAKEARHMLPTPDLDQTLFDAFVKANKAGFLFQDKPGEFRLRDNDHGERTDQGLVFDFEPGGKIEAALKDEDGFATFFRRFPQARAVVSLSRPGFDPKHQKMLLYATVATGELDSEGYLILAKRAGESWHVVKKVVLWSAG